MQKMWRIFYVLVMILFISSVASASDIKGTIGVVLKSGDIKYGAKVDVYLSTMEVSVPTMASESSYKNPYDYKRALVVALSAAWQSIQREMNAPSYISQKTKANFSGKFSFTGVSSGKYFIVVTYPTTIAMHKVLWQLPIVIGNKDLEVELSNDNMALPPYYER